MKLQHVSSEILKRDILAIFSKYLDLKTYKIFFFGSRVEGNAPARSDIDLGVLGSQPLPAGTKFKIDEELERLPILYKIDFVDFQSVPDSFRTEALKRIEMLN